MAMLANTPVTLANSWDWSGNIVDCPSNVDCQQMTDLPANRLDWSVNISAMTESSWAMPANIRATMVNKPATLVHTMVLLAYNLATLANNLVRWASMSVTLANNVDSSANMMDLWVSSWAMLVCIVVATTVNMSSSDGTMDSSMDGMN